MPPSREQRKFQGDLEDLIDQNPDAVDIDFKQNRSGGFSARLYYSNGHVSRVTLSHNTSQRTLRTVTYIDAQLDPIYKSLCEEFPWLTQPHRRANLYGLVQSGKSRAIMAILWCAIYQWRLRPFYFCLNMVKSYNQILKRDIHDFNRWLASKEETNRKLVINGLRGSSGDRNDPTCITLLMNNKYQQQRINRASTHPYLIVGDEGDTLIKHWDFIQDTTATGRFYHELEAQSRSTWMVTATPMALLNEKGVSSQTFELARSKEYRDIRHFEKHFLTEEEHESLAKDNTMLVPVVQRVINTCNVEGIQSYSSILINTRYLVEDHKQIARTLQNAGIGSYIVNGEGINYYSDTGHVERMNFTNVYALYNHFETMHEEDGQYRTHIIIAKRAANRAISFRPEPGKGHGGLIGQLLLPSQNGASRVQELRMCGNYSHDFPIQHLFMSDKDYQRLHAEVTYNIPNMVEANKIFGESRLQIEGVSIIANGPHDRLNVDDTKLANRHPMNKSEFDTFDECFNFCYERGFAAHAFAMTESELIRVPLTYQEKVLLEQRPRNYQDNIRNRICDSLGIQGGGFNVGWPHTDRLESLLRMTWRFDSNNAWAASKYIAMISEDRQYMNIVQWKEGFYEPDTANGTRPRVRQDRTIDFETTFPKKVAFLFLNPNGKWMYFVRKDDLDIGNLSHRN
jgi:hypothetical protein